MIIKEVRGGDGIYGDKSIKVHQPGIEPGTSAVLRPRHNQLDHRCFDDILVSIKNYDVDLCHSL